MNLKEKTNQKMQKTELINASARIDRIDSKYARKVILARNPYFYGKDYHQLIHVIQQVGLNIDLISKEG